MRERKDELRSYWVSVLWPFDPLYAYWMAFNEANHDKYIKEPEKSQIIDIGRTVKELYGEIYCLSCAHLYYTRYLAT